MWTLLITLTFGLFTSANQEYEEHVDRILAPIIDRCYSENPITIDQLYHLKKLVLPLEPATRCFLACILKDLDILTPKGRYDAAKTYMFVESINADKKSRKYVKTMSNTCKKVNNLIVFDGENGCDRAGYLFECAVNYAKKHGLTEQMDFSWSQL